MQQDVFNTLSKEELANVITHAIGFIICLVATPILITTSIKSNDWLVVFGISVFCFSMLTVYASSTAYHAMVSPRLKNTFRIIDHICIYLLIVGTHTPFIFLYLQTTYGYVILGTLWLLVVFGIIYKTFWLGKYERLSLLLYIAMGWSGVLTIPYMTGNISSTSIWWVLVGGVFYTMGIIFYLWEKLPYNHAIWHLFVMGGTAGHYMGLLTCFI